MITKVVWGGVVQAPYVCYGMDNGPGRPNDAMSVASFTEALVGLGGYPQPRDLVFRVYNSVYNLVLGNQQELLVRFIKTYPHFDPSPEGYQYTYGRIASSAGKVGQAFHYTSDECTRPSPS